ISLLCISPVNCYRFLGSANESKEVGGTPGLESSRAGTGSLLSFNACQSVGTFCTGRDSVRVMAISSNSVRTTTGISTQKIHAGPPLNKITKATAKVSAEILAPQVW